MRKNRFPGSSEEGTGKKPVSRQTVFRFFALLALVIVTALIYRLLCAHPVVGYYAFFAFLGVTTVLIFTYVIYNRGFSRRGVTREMLPDTMSEEEKTEFIEDGKRRMKRSSWMLVVLLALVTALLVDAMELIVFPTILEMFR
ncbi:MAG: hypothetical protein IJY42_02840 [Clostridia bacterium]|nr:hypothetical protein [Clostridia bacterium]